MTTLADIITAPWAITSPMLGAISDAYLRHLARPKIDLRALREESEEVFGAKGPALSNGPKPYTVSDGVAVLPVTGILAKGMNLVTQVCGGTSYTYLQDEFQRALDDPSVAGIVLLVDSPGGNVDGLQQVADLIFAARDQKPCAALVDGMACSAAYWIASAASAVYLTSDLAQVGSIGVVRTHIDRSQANAQAGEVHTDITAGEYKRIDSGNAPLTEAGKAYIQQDLDQCYGIFLSAVSRQRGVADVETVHSQMANGRVFRGQQAIDAGLADGVRTLPQVIAELVSGSNANRGGAGAAHTQSTHTETAMNLEELKAAHPEAAAALVDEGKALGASAERARIQGCMDAALPGHEALALGFAFDGKTTPGAAAMAINAAERQLLQGQKTALVKGAPDAIPGATSGHDAEAEAAAKAADDKKAREGDGRQDAHALAHQITAHITAEAAKGRRVTADQAAHELQLLGKE